MRLYSRLLMLVSWEDKMDRGASDLSVLKTFFLVIFCNVLLNKSSLKECILYAEKVIFTVHNPKHPIMEVKKQGHLRTREGSTY